MNCDLLLGLSLIHHAVNRWETIRNQPDVSRAKTAHTSQEVYESRDRAEPGSTPGALNACAGENLSEKGRGWDFSQLLPQLAIWKSNKR